LADPNTRQGKRTPVTLKIKFKSETLEQFIERYAVDVSQGGIFIRTKEPLAVGTQMKFEFQLRDASPLIAGEGTVVWTRENDPSRPAIAPGMGVRFDRLADGSQNVLERILAEKAKQAPSRSGDGPTKPPMFTDTPTRVAPAPVQEALGIKSGRNRADSEQTPLPKPMPFHSDAEDFDERAFEEATKVRSLDELAAASALEGEGEGGELGDATNTTQIMPPDELAARRQAGRADSTLADPPLAEPPPDASAPIGVARAMPDRDSAPGLPSPPEPARRAPTPAAPRPSPPPEETLGRTKLGVEPAKVATQARTSAEAAAVPRAVSVEPSRPAAPKRPSSAPIVIGVLVVVAAAMAAVWWFVLREDLAKKETVANAPGSGSAIATGGSDTTSGSGSAVAVNDVGSGSAIPAVGSGSAGSAGSAAVEPPTGPVVDTVIASSVAKGATVEIIGTDQTGPAPFTAKLEKDKEYKARVKAPGFQAVEVDIKGGQDKVTAKLVAKARILTVATEPAGAAIYIDGVDTQKITPSEVQLTPAQAARPRVRVILRRPGFRPVDQIVEASTFQDGDAQMTAKIDAKLQVMQRPTGGGTGGTGGGTGGTGGTGAGSATPTETGSGSATTPTTGAGSGSATTPPTGAGTGSGSATTPPSGTGSGSPMKPAAGTGSATPPAAGSGAGATPPAGGSLQSPMSAKPSAEPEPAWSNK
jgi:uncharacterized protein (TIGR02266 family)